MQAFVPYVVLSIFIALSSILFIGGCAIDKNWYPLFALVPCFITCFCAYGFIQAEPSGGWSESKFTEDSWMFLMMVGICSTIAFPVVLYRVGTLSWKGLTFQLFGDASTAAGFISFIVLSHKIDISGF